MQNIFLNGIPFLGSGRSPIHTLSHFFGNRWETWNHHFQIIIALFILNRILILKKVLKIDCHPVVTLINLPGLLLCNPNSRQCLTNDMVAINTRSSVFNFCKLAVTLKITQRGPLLCNSNSRQDVTNNIVAINTRSSVFKLAVTLKITQLYFATQIPGKV